MKKNYLLLSLFALLFLPARAQQQSEILWDTWGVPHIYASAPSDMYYGLGWAQMHNHANLLLRLYGQARGRAAEYWGKPYLESDRQVHLFNLAAQAQGQLNRMDAGSKEIINEFVRGVNAYAAAHPEAVDPAVSPVLPVTAADVIAHSSRVIYLQFLAAQDLNALRQELRPGSNSYAIAPSRSVSGKAMLVANPHLYWGDLYQWMEVHLNSPGFMAYGAMLVGVPNLSIAFNDQLGWTHTVNTIDASDRYELILQEGGYLLDGQVLPFESREVSLKVRQQDGSLADLPLTLKYARHGPVIGEKNGKAYALRLSGFDEIIFGDQYFRMAAAHNLVEFETALRLLQNPMFNVIYADKQGSIFYLFNGLVPRRSEGDWAFWNGTVDGTASKYIWNQYHSYDDLPRFKNPATGFVQNANDSPWTSTYPQLLNPQDYPAYMAPQFVPLRPQRAINLIKDDRSISFDELVDYKHDTGMEAAERFLDDLLAAVNQYPDSVAQRAAAVLKKWDKATEVDSRGAVLFASWFDRLNESNFSIPWNPAKPVTTPDGLKDPQLAVKLLVESAREVEKLYGTLDVPWGEVNRYKVGTYNEPGNGGSGNYGVFRTMYFNRNKNDNKNYAVAGDTYVAVVEFGDQVRAKVLLSYGNASQPGSKHVGDQLPLLSQKKLRDAWLDRRDVLQHLEKREVLPLAGKKQ